MIERTIHITVAEAESFDALPGYLKPLMAKAQEAAKTAYAPYSQYKVGAALLLADGNIIIGNNQENIAYPSGVCAERVAFFSASANNPGMEIKAVAVTAINELDKDDVACTPCGACRQVMAEYETKQGKSIPLVMPAGNGAYTITSNIASLLPFQFEAVGLKKE